MDIPGLHREDSHGSYRCAIITVSTSRYEKYGSTDRPERAEDASGKLIWGMIQVQGGQVMHYELVADDMEMIRDS